MRITKMLAIVAAVAMGMVAVAGTSVSQAYAGAIN
jgi:hypothetical protein